MEKFLASYGSGVLCVYARAGSEQLGLTSSQLPIWLALTSSKRADYRAT